MWMETNLSFAFEPYWKNLSETCQQQDQGCGETEGVSTWRVRLHDEHVPGIDSFIYLVRVVTEVELSYESVIYEPITRVMLISGLDILKINSKSSSYTSHCHAIRYSAIWWSLLYRYSTLCISIFVDLCTKDTPIWKEPLSQTHKLIVPWTKMIGTLQCN